MPRSLTIVLSATFCAVSLGCHQFACECTCFPDMPGGPKPSSVKVEVCAPGMELSGIAVAKAEFAAKCPTGTSATSCGCEDTGAECKPGTPRLVPQPDAAFTE